MDAFLQQIADTHGTPCFVYDLDMLYDRLADVDTQFAGRFEISYAVKSNPHPTILKRLRDRITKLDISSGGELTRALAAGWAPDQLSFTGPAKRRDELAASVAHGVGEVIVESVREAAILNELASAAGKPQAILVRIAPQSLPRGFGVNMSGKPSQFGIDEEVAEAAVAQIAAMDHLRLDGFHIYAGTQCLKPEAICENYANFIAIFRRLAEAQSIKPRMLVFGSGIGVPYHEGQEPVDLTTIAAGTNPLLDEMKSIPALADAACILETGRYLIGEAGVYLTRVTRIKESRGSRIAICDGGMNHHLGACGHLGSILHRNYQMFKVTADAADAEPTPHELVGCLCTSIDTLGHNVTMNRLDEGDVIAIRSSGAYGPTASSMHFISHPPAREIFIETRGDQRVVEQMNQYPPVAIAPSVETAGEAGPASK